MVNEKPRLNSGAFLWLTFQPKDYILRTSEQERTMNTKITVDGVEYDVVHINSFGSETIHVYTSFNDVLVGIAEITHDSEQIFISYGDAIPTDSFPYYDYAGPDELAEWIVATSYEA